MKITHIHFDTIDSTNTWAKKNYTLLKKEEITVITASQQSAGRGRFERKWISPPDVNIYATICFFREKFDPSNLSQLLANSAVETLKANGIEAYLKLPNDVFLNGKKLGGVLCEMASIEGGTWYFAGIGLNINMEKKSLLEIDQPASSLFIEMGIQYNLETLLNSIIKFFIDSINFS